MMGYKRATTLGFVLVLAVFSVAAYLYPELPQMVPTHWNAAGEPDRFTPKPWGAFFQPLIMLGVWVVLAILPRISPRGWHIDRFINTYGILMVVILAAMLAFSVIALLAASGAAFNSTRIALIVCGALLVILGNFLGKVRKNFFIGIRTPWTLADDEVWFRTHRLGGWLYVLAGLAIIFIAIFNLGVWPVIVAAGLATAIAVSYSYFVYRHVGDRNPET